MLAKVTPAMARKTITIGDMLNLINKAMEEEECALGSDGCGIGALIDLRDTLIDFAENLCEEFGPSRRLDEPGKCG